MKLISSRYDLAEFRRGKDKKPRKKRTLLGSIGKGAATGVKILAPLGAIGGTAFALKLSKSPEVVQALREAGARNTRLFVGGGGIGGGLYGGVSGAALGAVGGAGAYGISKLRNKDKNTKRSPLNKLMGK